MHIGDCIVRQGYPAADEDVMHRTAIASALLLGAGTIGGMPATSVVGTASAPAARARVQSVAQIDAATAAALIDSISRQFAAPAVQVRLGPVQVMPAGIVQRDVLGSGQVRVGQDAAWIALRFRALYDTVQGSVGTPELMLGGDARSRFVGTGGAVATALGDEVGRRLQGEFAQQSTRVRLRSVRSAPAGGGFLRIEANGTATLDGDRAATEVRALYDPRTRRWLQLAYELAPDATRSADAVAIQ